MDANRKKNITIKERRIKLHFTPEQKEEILERRKKVAEEYNQVKESKNNLTHEQLGELHNILVQACIDFINKYNIGDMEEVSFTADSLQMSAEHGSWQPCTDSSLVAYEEVPNEDYIFIREELDYSM